MGTKSAPLTVFHEDMPREARVASSAVQAVFGAKIAVKPLEELRIFKPHPVVEGGSLACDRDEYGSYLQLFQQDPYSLILTDRNVHLNEDPDSWVFGYNQGNVAVVSTHRMEKDDFEQRLKQVSHLSVHEIGHGTIFGPHMKQTTYKGSNGTTFDLGPHCPDKKCVMFEIADVKTPTDCVLIQDGKEVETLGLVDVVNGTYPKMLCGPCEGSILQRRPIDYLPWAPGKKPVTTQEKDDVWVFE